MLEIGSWYLTMLDSSLFQFLSGLVLGAVLVGAIWMLRFLYEQKKLMRIMQEVLLLHINVEEYMQNSLEKTAELSEKSLEKVAEEENKPLGKWNRSLHFHGIFYCPRCQTASTRLYDFCPHCGTKMYEEADDGQG